MKQTKAKPPGWRNRPWYWLCAVERESGTPIVDGPYDTEEEARRIGLEKIRDNFEVIALNTIDRAKATAEYRHRRFMTYGDLKQILLRTKHKL